MSGGKQEFHSLLICTVRCESDFVLSSLTIWSGMYCVFNLILHMCRLMVYTGWWMGTTLDLSTLVTQVLLSLANTKAFCRFLDCVILSAFLGTGAGSSGSPFQNEMRGLRGHFLASVTTLYAVFKLNTFVVECGGFVMGAGEFTMLELAQEVQAVKPPYWILKIWIGKWQIMKSRWGAVVSQLMNLKFCLFCEFCVWCPMCLLINEVTVACAWHILCI